MNEELISVIIPVYNRRKFIEKAIDSVLAQTYKNIELIIVDDGSTDNVKEIFEKYKDYKTIQIYSNENHGCSYSRNYGIEKSTGKFILFVDSDDWIEKDMVETLYKKMKEENSDIVICGIAMRNCIKNDVIQMMPRLSKKKYSYLTDKALVSNPVNKLLKKEIIVREQLRFPEDTHYGEDLCFSICYLLNCKSISLTKKCLYNYELHGENSIYDLKKGKGLFISFKKVYEYIQSKNLQSDKELMEEFSYLSREHIKSSFKRLLTDRKNFRRNYEEYRKFYYENINFYNSKIKRELNFYIIMILFCFITRTTYFITMKDSIKTWIKKILLKSCREWHSLYQKKFIKIKKGKMLVKIKYYSKKITRLKYLPIDKKRRKVPVEPWAFIRVKNEIATLDTCLKSILPVIKKGVIGYHKLNPDEKDDGTEEYIKKFCKENPGFILYKHDYEVIPACDERYKNLEDISDENTLSGYYNAVLSQIPKGEWLIKIDCDHIYDTEKLRQLMYLPKMENDVISISRFNLHYESDKLYVLKNRAVINPGDHWLVKNDDLKFFMDCGFNNGLFYAWEQTNLQIKYDQKILQCFDTDLFNWHFPCVKESRRFDIKHEELIEFNRFKISWFEMNCVYFIKKDMLDEERILEICRKFKIKNIK